jgi:hypothetical protein
VDGGSKMGDGLFVKVNVKVNESVVAGSYIHVNVRRPRAVRR